MQGPIGVQAHELYLAWKGVSPFTWHPDWLEQVGNCMGYRGGYLVLAHSSFVNIVSGDLPVRSCLGRKCTCDTRDIF